MRLVHVNEALKNNLIGKKGRRRNKKKSTLMKIASEIILSATLIFFCFRGKMR